MVKESSYIYSSILKYGYSNFRLEILEYCDKKFLINREQYYIDLLNPEYNILRKAGSRFGYKVDYATKKAISIASRGRKILRESLFKCSNVIKMVSSNTKLKLSLRGQGVNVKVFDKEKNLMHSFPTLSIASKYLGVHRQTMSRILNKGISYDDYIYEFGVKDLRIWIYSSDYELIEILENAKKTSIVYSIPRSTLSNYIKSGKLYKNKFYFIKK